MIFFERDYEEFNVIHILMSISFKFLICFVLNSFLSTITRNYIFTNIDLRFGRISFLSTVYTVMASKVKQSLGKEDIKKDIDLRKSCDRKEEQTKSSSYLLYVATIIAVLGAIASTVQVDSLNNFIDEFSARLCSSSLVRDIDEVANTTDTVPQELGLASKFDPLLRDGEPYNALNAINSRYALLILNLRFMRA